MTSTPQNSKVKSPVNTPEWMAPLSRELESVIAQRNLLTAKTRKKVCEDLNEAAYQIEDTEVEKLRLKAVNEVLSSEKTYLKHLETVEEFFMNPVRERGLLPNSDFATIFGDLPSIIQVNRELMTALESSNDRIGKVFLELAPYLKFYSTYANDFQSAVKLVEYWTEKNKNFRTLISNQESRPEVKHKLNALLITPIQRIPRYVQCSFYSSHDHYHQILQSVLTKPKPKVGSKTISRASLKIKSRVNYEVINTLMCYC